MSEYDHIAPIYDEWVSMDQGDIDFYVTEAQRSGGPVVELGVGTGRVAVPVAHAGVRVIGIDASAQMLAICERRAKEEGVLDLLDLRLGDFRDPPVNEQVPLVTSPFRSLSHLLDEISRQRALAAVLDLLLPGGRLIFDVATPAPNEVSSAIELEQHRKASAWERAEWDWARRRLSVTVRRERSGESGDVVLELAWLTREEWRTALEQAGFKVRACYGWFDRRPCAAGPYSIWVVTKPA